MTVFFPRKEWLKNAITSLRSHTRPIISENESWGIIGELHTDLRVSIFWSQLEPVEGIVEQAYQYLKQMRPNHPHGQRSRGFERETCPDLLKTESEHHCGMLYHRPDIESLLVLGTLCIERLHGIQLFTQEIELAFNVSQGFQKLRGHSMVACNI